MMKTAILTAGEKVHVMHLRKFDKDMRRHFAGEVQAFEHGVARISGYVFVIDDLSKHLFVRRPDRRVKLVPISCGNLIVNVIPNTVDIDRITCEIHGRSLRVTDGSEWSMDVKEFGWG